LATSSSDDRTTSSSESAPFTAELHRIAGLSNRAEHASALAAARALCAENTDRREAVHLLAVCERRAGRSGEALATLARLEHLDPGYARLHELRGHCLLDARAASAAIDAYRRALELNPFLADSWSALATLLAANRVAAQAAEAGARAADLARMPEAIRTAFALYGDGEFVVAEEIVREFVRAHGEHPDALRLLGQLARHAQLPRDAELMLARAVALAPSHAPTYFEYLSILLERQKHPLLLTLLEPALRREPRHPAWLSLQAAAYAGLGDHLRALPLYRELIAAVPPPAAAQLSALHVAVGDALKTLGRTAEAIESYRAAARAQPLGGEAYWGLANLKSYRFSDAEIEPIRRAAERADGPFADRYHLCFALGKALEDRGQWAESFAYYQLGNRLKRSELAYRPERIEKTAAELAALCTREFFGARAGYGSDSAAPIFVVGLPRSGSTLVEQILASHSEVDGTMELPHVLRLVQDLAAFPVAGGVGAYPAVLERLEGPLCHSLGERLLVETRPYRSGRARYVDKMPNNFLHVGLIQLLVPNARVIDVRRRPLAACFAIYKQLFAAGQPFAYGFEDIARYYRMYEALMAHWNVVLPGKVMRVDYERLVDDLPGTVRTILDFCGLEYQDACLEFHANPRPVHSASAEQVRHALHRDGLDQWRHYEPWLAPLKLELGEPAVE